MISLTLGHLFYGSVPDQKRWPSDKLIIFVRSVNCCTPNSIHRRIYRELYSFLFVPLFLGHSPISVLLVNGMFFLATPLFCTRGVFVCRISHLFAINTYYINTVAITITTMFVWESMNEGSYPGSYHNVPLLQTLAVQLIIFAEVALDNWCDNQMNTQNWLSSW